MFIKCWGARGSIPVSGSHYHRYGGDTTCLQIRSSDNDDIVIDAGTGIRKLGNEFIQSGQKQCNFIFTHVHWDHVLGFPFFKPLYSDDFDVRIYQGPFSDGFLLESLSNVMKAPFFPLSYSDIKADIHYMDHTSEPFNIGSIAVTSIPLSHPNGAFGYKFVENDKTFVFLTDNELTYVHSGGLGVDDYIDFCAGADLLIHDAEYTPEEYQYYRGWGHSAYTDVLDLAIQAGVARLGLHHINAERDDAAMNRILDDCHRIIQEQNLNLECFAAGCDTEIDL